MPEQSNDDANAAVQNAPVSIKHVRIYDNFIHVIKKINK